MCSLQFGYFILRHFAVLGSLENVFNILNLGFHFLFLGCGNLIAYIIQSLLGLEYHCIGFVSGIDCFFLSLILSFVFRRFLYCLLDILIGHVGSGSNGDVLLFSGSQIFSGNVYDTVGINIEGNFDFRHTSSCGRDSVEAELAEGLVVTRKLSLTLGYMNINRCLVILCRGEYLALLYGDSSISLD